MRNNYPKILAFALLIPVCIAAFALSSRSQHLIDSTVFTFSRPAEAEGATAKGATGSRPKAYRIGNQLPPRKRKSGGAAPTKLAGPPSSNAHIVTPAATDTLGVTLWRLRPERTDDTGARLLTMNASASTDGPARMVAERVGLDTVFKMGDKVRISVESPQAGFLYIIDRELRTDDKLGEPYLIFPTLKTRGGDNAVNPGRVIEVPAQTDNPFYFDITPMQGGYAGELLTVIVSPKKLVDLKLQQEPLKLSPGLVEGWEDQWERGSTTFELDGGRDLSYSEEEKEAGTGSRLLTQNSPAPQTLITVETAKGKTFLVSFPMKVAAAPRKP